MSVNIQILLSRDYYFPTLQIVFVWIAKCICLKYDKDLRKKSGHEWTTSGPYLPDFFVPGTQTPPVQTKLEKGKAREIKKGGQAWYQNKRNTQHKHTKNEKGRKQKKHTTQKDRGSQVMMSTPSFAERLRIEGLDTTKRRNILSVFLCKWFC